MRAACKGEEIEKKCAACAHFSTRADGRGFARGSRRVGGYSAEAEARWTVAGPYMNSSRMILPSLTV